MKTASDKWEAIEIKLGTGKIPEAVDNLNNLKDKVDTEKYEESSFLMVLTGTGYSYKHDDGIYATSIGTLKIKLSYPSLIFIIIFDFMYNICYSISIDVKSKDFKEKLFTAIDEYINDKDKNYKKPI